MKAASMNRFDRFLHAMATRPVPSEKPAKDTRTSRRVGAAASVDGVTGRRPVTPSTRCAVLNDALVVKRRVGNDEAAY